MRVVVVGATGNVGSRLLELLASDPRVTQVSALAGRSPDRAWPKTTFSAVDMAADDLSPYFEAADAVVHLGSRFQPTHGPQVTWRTNVVGSIRLFDAAIRAGVPTLIYASSVGAYSPNPGTLVDEGAPTDGLPSAGYSREKACLERVLDAVEARHPELRIVRFRPGFIFQRASGAQQRRLFAGPLLPTSLLRISHPPVVPVPAGLRVQALHACDAAKAYHLALTSDVKGPFNLAAEPLMDGSTLAALLGDAHIEVPPWLVRGPLAIAWWAHLVPADPALLDLALGLPTMDVERARRELGWVPRHQATAAVQEAVGGMAVGKGDATPPLEPSSLRGRLGEARTGVGTCAQP